ncbi:MAG: Crp/Fnr family transcriptional regulator [Deltaproteobacteria bacterium]|jgi:CRP/FNR family transcriptional regulator, cyclic AMP receptor protein
MVPKDMLKSIVFFEDLSDEMLERMAAIADLRHYTEGEYLNKRRNPADNFYIILEGAISLETEDITGKKHNLETLMVGAALGFSSLIETESKRYLCDARVITTPTRTLRFKASDLISMFYLDFELGFLIMKKIALIAKRRLLYRTLPLASLTA